MARTKKVTRASEEIVKKIRETDTAIEEAKENVKSLRSQKKTVDERIESNSKRRRKNKRNGRYQRSFGINERKRPVCRRLEKIS